MTLSDAAIAVTSVTALFAMAYAVRVAGLHYRWPAEAQRKLVHVGVGIHAMLLPLVLDKGGFILFAALALAALLVLRSSWARKGAGASVHSVERRSWGDLLFLVAVTVLFVRAPGDPALYLLPIAVLTLSDAAAAVIGTEYGRRRFGGRDRLKSMEGTVVFFVVTWMVAMAILVTATDVPRVNTVLLATVVAAFAAQIEAESWKGLDNLFVPVGIHALLTFNNNEAPLLLAALTCAFVALIVLAQTCSQGFGMTPHAGRSNAVCLFLAAAMTSPQHAILPVAAFMAHLASRRDAANPDLDDLDFVAVVSLIGVFWLTVGGLTGRIASEFYTISFAGVFAGLTVLTLPTRTFHWRFAAAAAISVVTWGLQRLTLAGDTAEILWADRTHMAITAALTILACAFGAAWRPILPFRRGALFTALVLGISAISFGLAIAGGWRSDGSTR
jgi:phytol kinase